MQHKALAKVNFSCEYVHMMFVFAASGCVNIVNIVKQEKICIKKFCRHCQVNSIITMYSCVQFALFGAVRASVLDTTSGISIILICVRCAHETKNSWNYKISIMNQPYNMTMCMVISNWTLEKWMNGNANRRSNNNNNKM